MAECAKGSEVDRGQVAAPASPASQSCRGSAWRSVRARDRAITADATRRAPVRDKARGHPRAFPDRDLPGALKHTRPPVLLAAVFETRRDVQAKLSCGISFQGREGRVAPTGTPGRRTTAIAHSARRRP